MDPYTELDNKDLTHKFVSLCSYTSLAYNKKMSLANVMLKVVTNNKLKTIFKSILDIESDFELVQFFITYDSTLTKSRFVINYVKNGK